MNFSNYIVFFKVNQKIIHKMAVPSSFKGDDMGQKLYFLEPKKKKYNPVSRRQVDRQDFPA